MSFGALSLSLSLSLVLFVALQSRFFWAWSMYTWILHSFNVISRPISLDSSFIVLTILFAALFRYFTVSHSFDAASNYEKLLFYSSFTGSEQSACTHIHNVRATFLCYLYCVRNWLSLQYTLYTSTLHTNTSNIDNEILLFEILFVGNFHQVLRSIFELFKNKRKSHALTPKDAHIHCCNQFQRCFAPKYTILYR